MVDGRPSRSAVALATGLVVATVLVGGAVWNASGDAGRAAEIAALGSDVMAFDLDRTTHVFTKLREGGVQTVVADEPQDDEEIEKIREHLEQEAEEFSAGRFADPERIHGREMPGLVALEEGADRIAIRYEPVATGGRIWYTTEDPALVYAIHVWFDAQVADHRDQAKADVGG